MQSLTPSFSAARMHFIPRHTPLCAPATHCQILRTFQVLLLVTIFLIGPFSLGQPKPLCIVAAGDGRADFPWSPDKRAGDKNGINEEVLNDLVKAISKDDAEPKLMLWTGDIKNVNAWDGSKPEDKRNSLETGLNRWRQIMKPLYDNKITILPVRGNHEVEWYKKNDA